MQKLSVCCRRSLPPLEKVSVSPKHCSLFKVASWSLRASTLFHFRGESSRYMHRHIFAHVWRFKTLANFPYFCLIGTLNYRFQIKWEELNCGHLMTVRCFLAIMTCKVLIPVVCFFSCTFSIWILLTKACPDKLCGVFHHVDSQNTYATPAVFLTRSGRIARVQVFPFRGLALLHQTSILSFFYPLRPVTRPVTRRG